MCECEHFDIGMARISCAVKCNIVTGIAKLLERLFHAAVKF